MAKRVKAIRKSSSASNEPLLKASNTQHDMICTLNWYSYNKDSDDATTYFLSYLKKYDTDVFDKLKSKSPNVSVSSTVGWLCRIYTLNESTFPLKYLSHIKEETNRVLEVVFADEAPSIKIDAKQRPSVQENVQNQLRELLGEIDAEVDNFLSNKCRSSFSLYEWMQTKKIKHAQAKSIADYYTDHVLSELKEAQSSGCEQLKEAYSFLTKKNMQLFVEFVESLIQDANKWHGVAKQISHNNRAPRARKPKPPLKQIERLQYLKEHETLKSIPPTQIVGATQLWVYNVKYKSLGMYVCTNAHGFMVKGCTILNFDTTESISKTLRKPEDVIPSVMDSGKVALKKILPSLKTKEKKLTGRINTDTILLRAI
jgi:hypothetical protein